MFIDLQTKFSDAQLVTATAISANVLDLRNAATPALADEGMSGPEEWIVVLVVTTATAAGAATLVLTIESDILATLASAPVVHYTSTVIPVASMVAGFRAVAVQLPAATPLYKRFLGLRYTIATGPLTAGAFSGYLTMDLQQNVIYPTGFVVL